ncbi:MAG TPA: DUF222 domain-containing protein [Marmoricola sp.]|nr:DUF222 domain-containing protein [Marmoricola sp.]
MTVHQLRPPATAGLIAEARAAVAAGLAVPAGALGNQEVEEGVVELAALESQVAAWRLRLVAEADARRLAEEKAATGTDALLARLTGETREAMNGGIWLARALREKYHATLEALGEGTLRLKQAWVIVKAAERAPAGATAEQVREAEELLVAKATGVANRSGRPMDAKRLRQAARRMFETMGREVADQCESDQLKDEESKAEAETWLSLHDRGDGTFKGSFVIPERHGLLLRALLERLTSPRRLVRDKQGQSSVDESVNCPHNWSERNGAAFCELIEHLPTEGWSGTGISLLVHISLEALRSAVGAARLDSGAHLSAAAARKLACEAGIIPAVLGGDSVPLDLGRERRLHTKAQRQALSALHDSCAVVGCDRPFAWCEIHHPDPWSQGGRTDLDNAIPLCGYHHNRAHEGRFDLRRHSGGEWRFHRRR